MNLKSEYTCIFCWPTHNTCNRETHCSNSLKQHDTGQTVRKATWKNYFHTSQNNVAGKISDQTQSVTAIYKDVLNAL